ncbi:MAG: DUF3530 family protein [Gammaproteobacteria bacterium]|jgi:hypothetical protein
MILRCSLGFVLLAAVSAAGALAQTPEPPPAAEPAALATPGPPDDPAPASGSATERLIAERLALSRFDLETLWLDTAEGPFLALHRPADEGVPFGGLVIVATPGSIVNNVPVPRALSSVAAAGGWSVLSLQPAPAGTEPAATVARVAAAVTYFTGLGLQNIVLTGDSGGATGALAALAGNLPPTVVGFVGVGAWEGDLTGIDVAILDIAGTRDVRALRWQEQRQAAARKYPNSLEAVAIDGAGPDFYGYAEHTARLIRGWLHRAAPAKVVSR